VGNSTSGKDFEREVEKINTRLHEAGRARVVSVPDPINVLRREGAKIIGHRDTRREVDFVGTLANGRSVAFEAKVCSHDRYFPLNRLEARKNDEAPTQLEILADHALYGALSFVLVRRYWDTDKPFPQWQTFTYPVSSDGVVAGITSRRSIPWADSDRYRLQTRETWLDRIAQVYDLEEIARARARNHS